MPPKAKAKKPEVKKPIVKPVAKKPVVKPPVVEPPVAEVVVEKPPVVEMEDFKFGGYTVQAPKGSVPLYSESHPILGLTKAVFQTAMTAGDGRVGEPGGQYVWRK